MTILENVLKDNKEFVENFEGEEMSHHAAKKLAILTCMDCRLIDFFEPALGLQRGDPQRQRADSYRRQRRMGGYRHQDPRRYERRTNSEKGRLHLRLLRHRHRRIQSGYHNARDARYEYQDRERAPYSARHLRPCERQELQDQQLLRTQKERRYPSDNL